MKLTTEQKNILTAVVSDIKKGKKIITLGGFGGTGKSVLVAHLAQIYPRFGVAAYTGKAAHVLRQKGIPYASTIHSLIYVPHEFEGEVYFKLADFLACEGILIDEASMVSREMFNDLCYFNIPLVFVGDHGQLPPIGDDFNLMATPQYVLEEIHRNAGEIAHFANYIRQGNIPTRWNSNGKVKFIDRWNYLPYLLEVDQTVCAFNKTRVKANIAARRERGIEGNFPVVGERVMCLRNNKIHGIFNGMQGIVKSIKKPNSMVFVADDIEYKLRFDPSTFNQVKYEFSQDREDPDPFDFCDVCTCHKVQGSEFNTGLVIEESCDLWDAKRWNYTAASRFKQMIYWTKKR